MVGFIIFLALYAAAATAFFIALVRWTFSKDKPCSCHGAHEVVSFIHTPTMCYPRSEATSSL